MAKRKPPLYRITIALLAGLILLIANRTSLLDMPHEQLTASQPGLFRVLEVADGDTITVDMNGVKETVRFIGVDTPETHDPRKPVQCFGRAAAAFTKDLLDGKEVRLEADPLNTNRDRYGRLLRYVYLADGTLVNTELIRQGYGFAYLSFPFTKLDEFRDLERQAREQNKGLWSECSPTLDENGYINSNPEYP